MSGSGLRCYASVSDPALPTGGGLKQPQTKTAFFRRPLFHIIYFFGAALPPGLRKYLKNSEFESSTITSPWLLKVAR